MDGQEKGAPSKEDASDGYLTRQSAEPLFHSKEEAVATLTAKLEALEKRVGLSAREMFNRRENSGEDNDDYREAVSLHAKIAFLNKK